MSSALRDYFRRFPDMVEVVRRARKEILNLIPQAKISLEVYCDPEIEDEHLVLYVHLPLSEGNAMERIREIRERCGEFIAKGSGWLHITLGLPPEKLKQT